MRSPRVTPLVVIVLVLIISALSSILAASDFAGSINSWSRSGPVVGVVDSLSVAPSNPSVVYAGITSDSGGSGGTSTTGIYKSTDGGLNWSRGGLVGRTLYSLAVDPTNSDTVYAGTSSRGLYKSTDGGASWSGPFIDSTADVYSLAVDPKQPSTLYASATNRGLLKSTDGGVTWNGINTGIRFLLLNAIAINPANTNIVYVSGGHGSLGGVYKSTDAGANWVVSSSGIPDSGDNVRALVLSQSNSSILYAALGTDVYKSTDGAASWTKTSTGLTDSLFTTLAIDPSNPSVVLAATIGKGIYRTVDGGMNWASAGLNFGVNTVNFGANSSNIYAGTRGSGVFKTTDGGLVWQQSTNIPNGDVRELLIDPGNPAIIYANNSDTLSKSIDHGANWIGTSLVNNVAVIPGFPTHKLAIDPTNPSKLFLGVDFRGVFKTTDGGVTWNQVYHQNTNINALAIDPTNPANIYLATYPFDLLKSTNGGATWTPINSPGDVTVLAVDPVNPAIVYAGTNFGVSKSTNAGASWVLTSLRNPGTSNPYVISLIIDPTNTSVLYAATFNGGAFTTTNSGSSWSPVFSDVAGHVLSFVTDTTTPNTVFAGTEQGVYQSVNSGQTSSALTSGWPSPAQPAMALAFDATGKYLYAGTSDGVYVYQLNTTPTPTPTPSPSPTYNISGRVADASNNAISGVLITFELNFEGTHLTKTTFTDTLGNYTSGDLGCQNSVKVTPSKIGYSFSPVSISFVSTRCLSGSGTANFTATPPPPNIVQFTTATFGANEAGGSANITVTRTGNASNSASVDFVTGNNTYASCSVVNGSAVQNCDFIITSGTLNFGANEVSKSFSIPLADDAYVEGSETLPITLTDPIGTTLGNQSFAIVTITDNDSVPPSTNPIDEAQFFVRQHYLDFLNREPDLGGLGYWTSQVTACGTDSSCIENRRVGVSAAFFIELEFQETGSYVYRLYKAAYGQRPTYVQFMPDRSRVVAGTNLEAGKVAFVEAFVRRPEFEAKYPVNLNGIQFIDALLQTVTVGSGVNLSSLRSSLIDDFNVNQSRARILRIVADHSTFKDAEYNRAFVIMQYFGYLRRDPEEGGYLFWLDVLNNRVPGNFRGMVCAFLTSAEYQIRFSPVRNRTDQICGNINP
jgi:photosystem II stability/assembly factor-like uncharacterized protein